MYMKLLIGEETSLNCGAVSIAYAAMQGHVGTISDRSEKLAIFCRKKHHFGYFYLIARKWNKNHCCQYMVIILIIKAAL